MSNQKFSEKALLEIEECFALQEFEPCNDGHNAVTIEHLKKDAATLIRWCRELQAEGKLRPRSYGR